MTLLRCKAWPAARLVTFGHRRKAGEAGKDKAKRAAAGKAPVIGTLVNLMAAAGKALLGMATVATAANKAATANGMTAAGAGRRAAKVREAAA